MNSYGFLGIPDSEVEKEVEEKFKNDPEKKTYSQQVGQIAAQYTKENPPDRNADRKARKAYRRKAKREIAARAKEQVKPVGCVGGFLFLTIIGSIISFFIQMFLRKHFEQQGVSMDPDEFLESDE